ncbi:MAG: tRNA-dihydrouridine synthase family protein [Victivallaceae bacterium]|nr:tRNA-dihydrouridine synthase family protein [Victivallaceae bacterium]
MMLYEENILLLAPLSGFTDLPYRRAARRGGCRYAFTEMVDAASIVYNPERAKSYLLRGDEEDFLGVQLVGADPAWLKRAARFLDGFDFSVIDFNLGCPVPKVVKKGAGAALGKNGELAVRCLEGIVAESRAPVTVKMRILDAVDPAPSVALAVRLAETGARAITVHGRTRDAFYTGPIAYGVIRAIAESVSVPVIANGGIHSVEDAKSMRRESNCSRLMLAQGAMGNPWLFRRIGGGAAPDFDEWKSVVLEHLAGMVALYGESEAMKRARKIVHDYLRGRGFPASARAEASRLAALRDAETLLAKLTAAATTFAPGRELAR